MIEASINMFNAHSIMITILPLAKYVDQVLTWRTDRKNCESFRSSSFPFKWNSSILENRQKILIFQFSSLTYDFAQRRHHTGHWELVKRSNWWNFWLSWCNIRGKISFQKLENFCATKALMSKTFFVQFWVFNRSKSHRGVHYIRLKFLKTILNYAVLFQYSAVIFLWLHQKLYCLRQWRKYCKQRHSILSNFKLSSSQSASMLFGLFYVKLWTTSLYRILLLKQ